MNIEQLKTEIEKLNKKNLEELKNFINELLIKTNNDYVLIELEYNQFKGSGKSWIAVCDPETRKIEYFLDVESFIKKDKYKGTKVFKVPLIEGNLYLFNSTGSKSQDDREYYIVKENKLELVK